MRAPRIWRLGVVQAVSQVSNFGMQLLFVPVFLSVWNADVYGLWLTLMAAPLLVAQVEVGFAPAAAPFMATAIHRHDQADARILFWASMLVTLLVAVILAILVALGFAIASSFGGDAGERILSTWDQQLIVYSGLGMAVLTMFMRSMWSLMYAADHQLTADIIVTGSFTVEGIATIFALFMFRTTPATLVVVLLCLRLASGLVMIAASARLTAWAWKVRGLLLSDLKVAIGVLWRPATGYLADPMSSVLQTQGVVFVVGHLIAPGAATLVYAHRLLSRATWQLSAGMRAVTNGELMRLFAQGDHAGLTRSRVAVMSAYSWLGVVGWLGLALVGPFVMHLWVGTRVAFDPLLFQLFALSVPFAGFAYGAKAVLSATNEHYVLSRVELAVTVATAIPFVAATLLLGDIALAGWAILLLSIVLSVFSLNALARRTHMGRRSLLTSIVTGIPSLALRHLSAWRSGGRP